MKKMIQSLTEKIPNYYLQVLGLYYTLALVVVFLCIADSLLPGEIIIFICLLPFALFELGLRIILCLAYGPEYKYSFLSYFLIDHPLYGNALRNNAHAKAINFPVFDKIIFPPGTGRILNLPENIRHRKIFNVNSLGFRGKEFSPQHKTSRLRIFCLGGSTTVCDSNDDNETWPAQLEIKLKNAGYDCEVINAGVPGWYSYQDYLRLDNEILHYEPDIILLHEGWNEEFEYSSLSLGEKWRPRVVRNAREENNLYCPPNKILSNTVIFSFYLAAQFWLKRHIFIPTMRFTNPRRWEVLLETRYILAWLDNLLDMARLAQANGSMIYTVDYPGLANLEDSPEERKTYVENSRLTGLYAEYQAISKKRISRTLQHCASVIPNLNAKEAFDTYKSGERLMLFHDEVHLTPPGNAILAQAICKKLTDDPMFVQRYHSDERSSNVNLDPRIVEEARRVLSDNPFYLESFIYNKIEKLKSASDSRSKRDLLKEVPADRYTTF